MEQNILTVIYDLLKTKYNLIYTNTFALDAGFTEDLPILCGKAGGLTYWLYDDYGELVFSYEVPGQNHHDHWHPQDIDEAIEAIEKFPAEFLS